MFADEIDLASLEADPAPILARLRAESPVCFVPALEMWLVTRWDDVANIEAHPELFSAATEPSCSDTNRSSAPATTCSLVTM